MNFKTTLVLLLLLVAGGAFFFSMRDVEAPDAEAMRELAERGDILWPIDTFERDAITQLELVRGDDTAVFTKDGEDWWQTAPVRFKLSTWSVNAILDALVGLEAVETMTPGKKDAPTLEQAGLATPAATLTATGGENQTFKLSIGKKLSGHCLIQLDGESTVRVVDQAIRTQLVKDLGDLRDKSLEAPTAAKTRKAEATIGDTQITLTKIDGQWFIDAKGTQRADKDATEALIKVIDGIYIREFEADNPASLATFGLDRPTATLTLTPSDDEAAPGVLRVGSTTKLEGDLYFATWSTDADAPPVVFSAAKSALEPLLNAAADDLRDKRVFGMAADEIGALAYSPAEGVDVAIERTTDGKLAFTHSTDAPALDFALDQENAEALLKTFAAIEASGYVPAADIQGEPLATASVTRKGEATARVTKLYAAEDNAKYIAVRDGETIGYLIGRDMFADVATPDLALRDRALLNWEKLGATQVVITRGDTTHTFTATAAGDAAPTWSLEGHDSFNDDQWMQLTLKLANLTADQWLAEETAVEADLTVTITPAEGEDLTLQINTTSQAATLTGAAGPFTAPADLIETLQGEFVSVEAETQAD